MDNSRFMHFNPVTKISEYAFPGELPKRSDNNSTDGSGYNTLGKKVALKLNQYRVNKWPQKKVFQYDVMIGSGAETRALIKKAWKSKKLQAAIAQVAPFWLFDGNKIAWCSAAAGRGELKLIIDFDDEAGKQPRPGHENKIRVVIKQSKEIPMAVISAFLDQKMAFDNTVLEAITFLDHMMRQWPSDHYVTLKRSSFNRAVAGGSGAPRMALDDVVEAMKGVYSSMRLHNKSPSDPKAGPSTGLAVNVDVANGVFWTSQPLEQAARNFCKGSGRTPGDYIRFGDSCKPVKDRTPGQWTMSHDFKELRKLSKLQFSVKHRGKDGEHKYRIKRFVWDLKKYGPEGANAKTVKFSLKDDKGGPPTEISLLDFFLKRYNMKLNHWNLPIVETEKAGLFPMEVCQIVPQQQYKFKLSPDQTAKMIKFAVTRPKERLDAIQNGINMLKWHEDPYLKHYGVEIDPKMTTTSARLLQPPEVQYNGAKCSPGTSGRWDLRGKKFLITNPVPLKSWGVCVIDSCVSPSTVQNFLKVFIQTYVGHGGQVANRMPLLQQHIRTTDLAQAAATLYQAVGNANQMKPQILLFILPEKNSITYERLKKNMDCRFGIVSQMLNKVHVEKAQPQYCSNVCMKFNSKLGGTTCRVAGKTPTTSIPFKVRTMILGSDVSHPSPNSPQGSMAAITMSMDKDALRYAAAVETNGRRVEMITKGNFKTMILPLFLDWIKTVGGGKGPQHIFYFRDGVSEGQYIHVLEQEVVHLKEVIAERFGKASLADIKFTVVVCSKRHHVRFFPTDGTAGDRNGNAYPGTLVERDVTHPFEHDFYLCSHTAIQGTARPVHYHVLLDEAKVPLNTLHTMIYNASYQYARATTPVSLFPAVYYAHLASNRARSHEAVGSDHGARGGQKQQEQFANDKAAGKKTETTDSFNLSTEVPPLTPMGPTGEIREAFRTSMWYI